jgi:hypothetical protein
VRIYLLSPSLSSLCLLRTNRRLLQVRAMFAGDDRDSKSDDSNDDELEDAKTEDGFDDCDLGLTESGKAATGVHTQEGTSGSREH